MKTFKFTEENHLTNYLLENFKAGRSRKRRGRKKHVAYFIIYLLLAIMQIPLAKLLEEFVNKIEKSVKLSGKKKEGKCEM